MMPQMRKIAVEGGFIYKKPSKKEGGYKPISRNMNHWYFADLSKNVSEQVLAIGEAYNKRVKDGSIKHMNGHPVQLLRYFYFLYLTGSRLMEPMCTPSPSIVLSNTEGKVYIEVQKVNEKHRSPDGKERDVIVQDGALPDERLTWDGEPICQIGRVEQTVLLSGDCGPRDDYCLGGVFFNPVTIEICP